MIKKEIKERLEKMLKADQILTDQVLKSHTTFKIGGHVGLVLLPESFEQVEYIIEVLNDYKEDFMILGNGSNVLFTDRGYHGTIIKIGDSLSTYQITEKHVIADAGILLSRISKAACAAGFTGMEFATGIPGTLGGGVIMNAGAYNGELKDVVEKVLVYEYGKGFYELTNEQLAFGYRTSSLQDKGIAVLRVYMRLQKGNQSEIDAMVADFNERRTSKQPLHLPSAGSTFRRPVGGYASKLIEDAGLKGLRHRGAMVSDKHSGFIVNIDNATFEDVMSLIQIVQKTVMEKFGIKLETEVKIIKGEN